MIKKLVLIVGLALFLRCLMLTTIPNGIYVDDAAIGYNAYSILRTGKDEYGHKLPLFLKSWNAYTPSLVVYFATVPIKLLGLNVLALRLTPVILGTLTVVVVGIISYQLNKKYWLIASLLLAINPTHILFSRSFFEATLSILLFSLALALVRKKLLLAVLFLALSTYAYHSTRLLAYPLLVYWIFERRKSLSKYLVMCVMLFVFSQIPQFIFSQSSGSAQNLASKSWVPQALSQKYWPLVVAREFMAQYLVYYSPRSLFHLPDPDLQRSLPELSEFYTWLVVPYIIGLIYLIKNWKKHKLLLFVFLIFPIPAAFAKDPFSTLRASIGLIPLTIVMSMGIVNFKSKFKSIILTLFFGLSLASLYRSLFVLLPNERKTQWHYGYSQVFHYISSNPLPAVIDVDKPVYVLYLFYQKIDPRRVQSQANLATNYTTYQDWTNYYHDQHVDFRTLVWREDIYKNELIVGSPLLVSEGQAKEHFLTKQMEIGNLVVYKTNPQEKLNSLKSD